MTYQDDIRTVAALDLPWVKLSDSNILITGASGLIGSSLVEVLMERHQRDYNVYAMGRNIKRMETLFQKYLHDNCFHILAADVTKPLNSDIPFHYIIHAASGAAPVEFAQRPVEVMMSNIEGVHNLIEYGRFHGLKRFLYVSSGEVYGEGDGREFYEEYSGYVNPMNPRACYPSGKRASETLCASYAQEYEIDVVVARPCHIYGPSFTVNDNRVYAQFIRNVSIGEDVVMKSTGEQFRSWCYVVDCVSGLLYLLLKGEKGEAYNIADASSNLTIKELAEMICSIGGKQIKMEIPDTLERAGYNLVKKSIYNTNKIERLGWRISGSMYQKMMHTINEFEMRKRGV